MTVYRSAGLTASPPSGFGNIGDLRLPIIGCTPVAAIAASTNNSPSSVSAEDTNFPVANLLNPSTHLRWATASDVAGADVFLDATGFTTNVNYVAFAAHNFTGFTVTVYGYTTTSPSDQVQIFEPTLITNNTPLLLEFPQGTYNQIRVKISGTGVRSAAVMYAGLLLRMERGVKIDSEHAPTSQAQKTDVLSGFSESGQFIGRLVRNQIFETKFEFSNITDEFFSTEDGTPLWVFLKFIAPNTPFFIAWAPQDYDYDLGFFWLITDPMPTRSPVTRRWSVVLEARGYA